MKQFGVPISRNKIHRNISRISSRRDDGKARGINTRQKTAMTDNVCSSRGRVNLGRNQNTPLLSGESILNLCVSPKRQKMPAQSKRANHVNNLRSQKSAILVWDNKKMLKLLAKIISGDWASFNSDKKHDGTSYAPVISELLDLFGRHIVKERAYVA